MTHWRALRRHAEHIRHGLVMGAAILVIAALSQIDLDAWLRKALAPTASGPVTQGTAAVIEGDTLVIGTTRIRLHGMNPPESGQRCTDAQDISYACDDAQR